MAWHKQDRGRYGALVLGAYRMFMSNRYPITTSRMQSELEISRKTAYRLIRMLERAGLPIVHDKSMAGGYGGGSEVYYRLPRTFRRREVETILKGVL